MTCEAPEPTSSPLEPGDRIGLFIAFILLSIFSLLAFTNGWDMHSTGEVDCPFNRPDGPPPGRVHLHVHVAGNLLAAAGLAVLAIGDLIRALFPVRLHRVTRHLLSVRAIAFVFGVILAYWSYLLGETCWQVIATGGREFFYFRGPDSVLNQIRTCIHTIGLGLIGAALGLGAVGLLTRALAPGRWHRLAGYPGVGGCLVLILAALFGALGLLGYLLSAVL